MRVIGALLFVLTLSSCATLLNKDKQTVYFYSDTNKEAIEVKDSIYELPLTLDVLRSKEELKVTLRKDTLVCNFTVLPELDEVFLYGNALNAIGYIVDWNSDRRFRYKKDIYLDVNESTGLIGSADAKFYYNRRLKKRFDSYKGDLFLYLTYAPINYLSYDLPNYSGRKDKLGTWGGDIGLVYYYADTRFFQLGVGGNSSGFFIPMEYDALLTSTSVQLKHVHDFKRFNLGYGLFVARQHYREELESDLPQAKNIILRDAQTTGGIALSSHYKISNTFSIGLNYQSSVYRLSSPKAFSSNHVVSLELTQRIRLSKKKKVIDMN